MATSVYKVTNCFRGEPVGDDAYTKFAFALEHVSGKPLSFVQTQTCTSKGIAVERYGAVTGFVEDEISTATFDLVGTERDGTEYTATVTIASVATNTDITLETGA